jgi:hypothetical protein
MMPGFMQTVARILPLYYVNEGLRASMIFGDHMAALRHSAIIGFLQPWSLPWGSSPPNGKRTNERNVLSSH